MASTPPSNEETVLYVLTSIENKGSVPRYAWIKTPRPALPINNLYMGAAYRYDPKQGFSSFSEDRIFCISKIEGRADRKRGDGHPAATGGKDRRFVLHSSRAYFAGTCRKARQGVRTGTLPNVQRAYWKNKLDKAARISLPERRIDEMIRAGLLHLDMVTYGKEPDGILAANVGVYSPIGTESAPIITILTFRWGGTTSPDEP